MSQYLITHKEYATPNVIEAHNLFSEFRKAFFEDGVSFFDSSLKLFDTDEVFREYEKRIIKNYDPSRDDSKEKYTRQLENSSKKFRHFFANLIWLYNLPMRDKYHPTKVDEILLYLQDPAYSHIIAQKTPQEGYINYGNSFQAKYYDVNFIYYFSHDFIKNRENPNFIINNLNIIQRMQGLSNARFKDMQNLASRHVLNYLFNPAQYEPIVCTKDKRKIITHFLGNYDDEFLDEDLYKIRKDGFGFDESLYAIVYEYPSIKPIQRIRKKSSSDTRTAILSNVSKQPKDYNMSFIPKHHDCIEDYKNKLENGILAEKLIYENIIKTTNKPLLINALYKQDLTKNLSNITENIDKIIYYTKYYDSYAPFDLITTKDEKLLYIEVKSTLGNEIYFSRNEILFAYEHQDNYEVKIVKNQIIYTLEMKNYIQDLYDYVFHHAYTWQAESVKFPIEFL